MAQVGHPQLQLGVVQHLNKMEYQKLEAKNTGVQDKENRTVECGLYMTAVSEHGHAMMAPLPL
jgi:hypothetical protein